MTEHNESFENAFNPGREAGTPGNDGDATGPALNYAKEHLEAELERGSPREASPSAAKWPANVNAERTLAERAYAAIYAAIIDGTFAPGDRLRIEDLSSSLQISPTPIREALNRLEAAGLAEHEPHRGSRVSTVSAGEFRDLYELRFILEPLAVYKAAQTFTKEDAAAAQAHAERLSAFFASKDMQEAWEANTAFHFTLYRAAKSRWLVRLIVALWDSCRRYRLQQGNEFPNPARSQADHERILAACIAHDPQTASLLLYNHTARYANVIAKQTFGQEFFALKEAEPLSPAFDAQAGSSPSAGPVRRDPQSAK